MDEEYEQDPLQKTVEELNQLTELSNTLDQSDYADHNSSSKIKLETKSIHERLPGSVNLGDDILIPIYAGLQDRSQDTGTNLTHAETFCDSAKETVRNSNSNQVVLSPKSRISQNESSTKTSFTAGKLDHPSVIFAVQTSAKSIDPQQSVEIEGHDSNSIKECSGPVNDIKRKTPGDTKGHVDMYLNESVKLSMDKKGDACMELFDGTIETPSFTSEDLPTSEIDISVFQQETIRQMAFEKMSQEKTLFSENLGLIPADSEIKAIVMKNKAMSRGVRTRKNLEDLMNSSNTVVSNTDDNYLLCDHKHPVDRVFKCGACANTFVTICGLHDHLQCHSFGGSYHYDHVLRTAFPKYDTACVSTQTIRSNEDHDPKKPTIVLTSKRGRKPKKQINSALKVKFEKPKSVKNVSKITFSEDIGMKRKRGRPRKYFNQTDKNSAVETRDEMQSEEIKEKKISKFKVKTVNGGLTWEEVKRDEQVIEDVSTESVLCIKQENSENIDEIEILNTNDQLVEKFLKDVDVPLVAENLNRQGEKKSHKRKMSMPRKVLVGVDAVGETDVSSNKKSLNEDEEKIMNSRKKPEVKIKCDFCPFEFNYTRGLIRHEMEKHADMMKFQCDICNMKFMRKYNLNRHKLCSHTKGKTRLKREKKGFFQEKKKPGRKPRDREPESSLACEVCGKVLPESKVEIHMRIHTGERPYICHVCGKGLISDKKLKRHLLIHSEVNRHTCEVCGQGFSMKYKLRTHMYIHTGHKPYLCSVCGAEFNNSTSLLHHHRTVHLGDKRFECNICGGRYGKKSQLEEHMFSHSNERTQTCRYCGKTFKHAKSLRRHEFTHVSDAKFPCDQCDAKFSRKDNLERHKMNHFEVTLQCSFCRKKFRDREPLLEHEQNHINQRRFQCTLCKEKFQNEAYFYNHMEKSHQISRDNVPMVTSMENSLSKEDKGLNTDMAAQNIVLNAMKMTGAVSISDQMTITLPLNGPQDTLNLSMNAAGIIPTSQDLISNTSNASIQSLLVTPNNSHSFSAENGSISLNMNTSRSILNPPISHQSFASATAMLPTGHEVQRGALAVMNVGDAQTMRLPLDQQHTVIPLTTSESMMLQEQQRLMQETLGSSLNMQTQGYRLQNMY